MRIRSCESGLSGIIPESGIGKVISIDAVSPYGVSVPCHSLLIAVSLLYLTVFSCHFSMLKFQILCYASSVKRELKHGNFTGVHVDFSCEESSLHIFLQ